MSTIVSATNAVGKLLLASGATGNAYFIASGVTDIVGTSGNNEFRSNGVGTTMHGGLGDDSYYVYTMKDVVQENANSGIDTVASTVNFTLGPNIENLELTNDTTWGVGNSLDNILKGGAGSQTLDGAGGDDVMTGGAGADIFVEHLGGGHDLITDFQNGVDRVRLQGVGITSFTQVQADMTQSGANVVLTLDANTSILFQNHNISDFSAADFMLGLNTSNLKASFTDDFSNGLSLYNGTSGTWRTNYGYGGPTSEDNRHLNDEAEAYTDAAWKGTDGKMTPIDPFSVSGGVLNITSTKLTAAQSAENWGLQYSSGLLTTRNSFAQEYGYFEVKAKMPAGQGMWPAFWLLPSNGSWPPELDVFEELGKDPNTLYLTSHTNSTGTHTFVQSAVPVDDVTAGFHTYGVLWTKANLIWYVDGTEVARTATPADMNQPMYMLLNLAVGGGWGGGTDATTPTSATMQVDYVHVYALPESVIVPASQLAANSTDAATAAAVANATAAAHGATAATIDTAAAAEAAALTTTASTTAATTAAAASTAAVHADATTTTAATASPTTTAAPAAPASATTSTAVTTTTAASSGTAPAGYADPTKVMAAADVMTGTAATDHWAVALSQLSTTSAGVQKALTGFANAGGWAAANNDWVSLTGFSKGSTMSWDHDVGNDGHTGVYRIHDAATNHDFFIQIQSLNGKHVALGDYNFY